MGRKPLPYDEIVSEIRKHVAEANLRVAINYSDDTDQWYVGRGQDSPMERQAESVGNEMRQARDLGAKLLEIGEPAAPAVAKGLRTVGSWRENLLPFAKKHLDLKVIREALELITGRRRDGLANKARSLLDS